MHRALLLASPWRRGSARAFSARAFSPCRICQLPVPCSAYFCPYCDKITSTTNTTSTSAAPTYFELLEHPAQTFSLDSKLLERNYRKLAMRLHPDQFSQKSVEEQELSAAHSAKLNEAYSTLKSPLRRALYMLELRGVNVLSGESTTTATAAATGAAGADMEILTETMELREQLDEASTVAEYEVLRDQVKQRIAHVETALATEIGDLNLIDSAVRTAVRLRYLEKVLEEVAHKIRNFDDDDK